MLGIIIFKWSHLQNIYFTFIGLLIDYADIVLDIISDNRKSESWSCTCTITDDTKLASKQLVNDQAEWVTLQPRNDKSKLIKMCEMFPHFYLQCINTAPEDQTILAFSKL